MRTLRFKCSGQKLTRDPACDFDGIVAGTRGYLQVQVDFDGEWTGTVRAAEFSASGQDADIYPALMKNGLCAVPNAVTDAKIFSLRIVGKCGEQKIITNKVTVKQGW